MDELRRIAWLQLYSRQVRKRRVRRFWPGHACGRTIGAAADNGIGIAGINWRVQLMSVKFIESDGSGYLSDAILAFDKITSP